MKGIVGNCLLCGWKLPEGRRGGGTNSRFRLYLDETSIGGIHLECWTKARNQFQDTDYATTREAMKNAFKKVQDQALSRFKVPI